MYAVRRFLMESVFDRPKRLRRPDLAAAAGERTRHLLAEPTRTEMEYSGGCTACSGYSVVYPCPRLTSFVAFEIVHVGLPPFPPHLVHRLSPFYNNLVYTTRHSHPFVHSHRQPSHFKVFSAPLPSRVESESEPPHLSCLLAMGLADKLGIGRSATFIATVNVHELTQGELPLPSSIKSETAKLCVRNGQLTDAPYADPLPFPSL